MTVLPQGPTVDETVRRALSNGERPARPTPVAVTTTFTWRVLMAFRHAPQRLIETIVMPFMLLLFFTFLFGGAIGGSPSAYLHYFLPGILVMTVLLMTVNAGTLVQTEVDKGIFDRFRSLPFWQPAVVLGTLVGDLVRYVFALLAALALGLALGFRPDGGATGVVFSLLLLLALAFSVSWIFTTLGLLVRSRETLYSMSNVVLFTMCFVSNIFTQRSTMPGWIQALVTANPVSHAVTAVRGLTQGTATAGQVVTVLVAMGVITLVFAPLTMRLYEASRK